MRTDVGTRSPYTSTRTAADLAGLVASFVAGLDLAPPAPPPVAVRRKAATRVGLDRVEEEGANACLAGAPALVPVLSVDGGFAHAARAEVGECVSG